MSNDQVEMKTPTVNKGQQSKTISTVKRSIESTWIVQRTENFEVEFQWVVTDFSRRPLETRISSPNFPSCCSNVHVWNLHLYPRSDRVAVYLLTAKYPNILKTIPIAVEYEITLFNGEKQVLSHKDYAKHTYSSFGSNFSGYINILDYQLIENGKLLPSDELHVHCRIRYEVELPTLSGHFDDISQSMSSSSLTENLAKRFENLFNEEMMFSDMEIQVKGQRLRAHKLVLASCSPLLSLYLASDEFIENESNIMKIEGFDPPVIKEMLRFLYTDRVENINVNLAKSLFLVAEKYLINSLKFQIEVFLSGAVTALNSCDLLEFAYDHSAAKLKKIVFDFIIQNSVAVIQTEDIHKMKHTHPDLAFEILDALMAIEHR